jgi:hypothetical protein
VESAVAAAGPLLLGSLAQTASTTGGAETLLKMLPANGDGILGGISNIGSMLGGLMNAGGTGSAVQSVLGNGANAMSASLSKATGFNVAPLLGMLAPALMGVVGTLAQRSNLDASGLAALLSKEHAEFASNPANAGTMTLVNNAMAAGEQASAMITSFGSSWNDIAVGPAAVLYMVASADMSGPIGSVKEARAANDALVAAAHAAQPTSLIATAFSGGITREQLSALKSRAPDHTSLLSVIRSSIGAVRDHAPAESRAYNDTLFAVATATATAAKEGGFLGIGGTLVSADEQVALDTLKAAFS